MDDGHGIGIARAGSEVGMADKGSRTRVLVVDDEPSIRDIVRGFLERDGMTVIEAADGPSAVEIAREAAPDVVVLDLMLPGFDGLEVLRRIRTFSDPFVLLLTARSEEVDRIVGLTVGADDYLTKPFSPRELVARVRALMRRRRPGPEDSGDVLRAGDLLVDPRRRTVTQAGEPVDLTVLEFDLLAALVRESGMVFTRQQLLDAVWGVDFFGDDHVLDVHVANLRRKLGDDASGARYIETVRGVGFRCPEERR
jgi:two-component system, OmpR family, alkaline phosphatase synthesis response regulator PhoP